MRGSLATLPACAATAVQTVRKRTLCVYNVWTDDDAARAPLNCQLLYDLGNI